MKRQPWTWREKLLVFTPLLVFTVPLLSILQLPSYVWNPLFHPREKARRDSCSSNMKQISLGMLQYIQDYDDRLPLNTPPQGWANRLTVYTKSCPVMACPSDPGNTGPKPTFCPSSYWMNGNCFDSLGRGLSMKAAAMPSSTYWFGDGDSRVGFNTYVINQSTWKSNAPYAVRHLNGANYAFLDGHVKNIRSEDVASQKNMRPGVGVSTFRFKK